MSPSWIVAVWCIVICYCATAVASDVMTLDEDVAKRHAIIASTETPQINPLASTRAYSFCSLTIGYLNTDYKGNHEHRERNTALLYIRNSGLVNMNYTWQHSECYECPVFAVQLAPGQSCVQRVQTSRWNIVVIHVNSTQPSITCPGRYLDSGEYNLHIYNDNNCDFTAINDPYDPDMYVLYAFLFYIGLALVWVALNILYRSNLFDSCLEPIRRRSNKSIIDLKSTQTNVNADMDSSKLNIYTELDQMTSFSGSPITQSHESNPEKQEKSQQSSSPSTITVPISNTTTTTTAATTATTPQPKQRLHSLDAFRGLSLTIMIFVNYGGAGYWYFEHAPWNGLTLADTVFPWFLWMMGTSLVFSFRGLIKRKTPPWLIVWKIVWRSVKLFAIGLFMGTSWGNDLEYIRIPGVLQRFGITYLVAALVYYPFAKRAKSENGRIFGDIIRFWPEWLIHFAMLAVYLGLTFGLPLPNGCPTGYVGPGGLADWGRYQICTGGAAGYADLVVFTSKHMYNWPTPGEVYYTTAPFDPEGLFTTIPSIFLVLLGSQAGKIIAMHSGHKQILLRWLIWGVITGCLALLLCEAKKNGGWIPINKNLWSLSYIFAMASTAFLLLTIMYIIIDVFHIWNGAPFIYPGMNSIVIYICHSVFAGYFPVSWAMPDPTSHWQALILCCWGTSLWVFVAYVLHKKRIYVSL